MASDDYRENFFAGVLMVLGGAAAFLYILSMQQFPERILVLFLPLLPFESQVPWHGPVSVVALAVALVGFRLARRADLGLPFWSDGPARGQPARDRLVIGKARVQPIVGTLPLRESEVTERVTNYVNRNGLWHPRRKANVVVDQVIGQLVGNKRTVDIVDLLVAVMSDLTVLRKGAYVRPILNNADRLTALDTVDVTETKPVDTAIEKAEAAYGGPRTPNPALLRVMTPSPALAQVIGDKPMARPDVVKALWEYIKKHGLQDTKNKRMINADEKLLAVFNGRRQVSMFDMTKLVSQHLS